MKTKLIEVTNMFNWGKFCLARFTAEEWAIKTEIAATCDEPEVADVVALERSRSLIGGRGWTGRHLWVMDLQTGEGAFFYPAPHGHPREDLLKHRIWVCPMFEPFLAWLYKQDTRDLAALPQLVELPDAESMFAGYRRPGPTVHILHEGMPLCRFSSDVPGKWPSGHVWARIAEISDATCPECLTSARDESYRTFKK